MRKRIYHTIVTQKGREDILLAALPDIAADPSQCSRGWLQHVSLTPMDLVENLVKSHGQVPWNELITSLWSELLSHVDEASLELGASHLLPYLVSGQCCLIQKVLRIPCVHRSHHRHTRSRLRLRLLMPPALVWWESAAVVTVTTYSRPSRLASSALPALAGGICSLAYKF